MYFGIGNLKYLMNMKNKNIGLKIALAIFGIVPMLGGISGWLMGPKRLLKGVDIVNKATKDYYSFDSEFRYLSGLWLAFGFAIYWMIPRIEKQSKFFTFIGSAIVLGSLGRLVSILQLGVPKTATLVFMGLELTIVPILVIWVNRVGKKNTSL